MKILCANCIIFFFKNFPLHIYLFTAIALSSGTHSLVSDIQSSSPCSVPSQALHALSICSYQYLNCKLVSRPSPHIMQFPLTQILVYVCVCGKFPHQLNFFNTVHAEWLQIGSQFVKYVKVLFSKKDFFVPKLIRHFDSYLNSNSFADFIVWYLWYGSIDFGVSC